MFADAARALTLGLCDAALVGGADSLCLTTLCGFHALQLVSAEPCRPADARRDGISIGEGAAFALLQRRPEGEARYRLRGWGESADAHHMSSPDPDGDGARRAMSEALRRGGLRPEQVAWINLHGTATPANDRAEDRAVTALFGDRVPCSSTKGWTGHTLGAAGAVEAVLSLLALEDGLLPRSLNTRVVDPAFGARVLTEATPTDGRIALSNSFGFGGSNCALLLEVLR